MKSSLRKNWLCLLLSLLGFNAAIVSAHAALESRPNVLFILADDLGYGDLGCYGQKRIKTPNLDRLAAEGTRFTQAYAGTTVCAPSRCSLMTGKHTGHAIVRGNQSPEAPLMADELTIPQVFKAAGYSTSLIGKWGLGGDDTSGAPNRKGFDYFYGFPSQTAAHNYYPPFLMQNSEKIPLPGNEGGKKGTYAHDLFMEEANGFIRTMKEGTPFFLYLAVTIPHANNEERPNGMQVPSDSPYSNETWPQTERNFAAMVTRLDTSVGQLLALLKELGMETNTLVLFTSDNGPHAEGGHNPAFFESSGGLRGIKRDLYEGGVRVPLIVRWPGKIKVGAVSDQVIAFWDWLPTFAAFTGQPQPKGVDGLSILPALLENRKLLHPPLYWEFHEGGFRRAARMGTWKGVSLDPGQSLELYDLATDPAEKKNVAAKRQDIVRQIEDLMNREHVPDPKWPDRTEKAVQP
jgi:arylsulfatase A-like enzyme